MARKPQVSTRVPEAWKHQIQEICAASGKRESEVICEAIAAYLGKTPPDSVKSPNRRVSILEAKFEKIL